MAVAAAGALVVALLATHLERCRDGASDAVAPVTPGVATAAAACEPEAVMPVLLAHQGGWDEILLVLVPIALFALLLVVANRRADAIESARRAEAPPDPSRAPDAPPDDRAQ